MVLTFDVMEVEVEDEAKRESGALARACRSLQVLTIDHQSLSILDNRRDGPPSNAVGCERASAICSRLLRLCRTLREAAASQTGNSRDRYH